MIRDGVLPGLDRLTGAPVESLVQEVKNEATVVGVAAERRYVRRDLHYRREGQALVIALPAEAGVALPDIRVTPPVRQRGVRPRPLVRFGKRGSSPMTCP